MLSPSTITPALDHSSPEARPSTHRVARLPRTGASTRSAVGSLTRALTKVMIVHSSPVLRFGIITLLHSFRRFRVCGQTDSVPEAREMFSQHRPDAVLLGLTLRHGDGIGLIKDLKKCADEVCVLIVTARHDALSLQRSLRAGARGYIATDDPLGEIPRALHQILLGELYASPSVSRLLLKVMSEGDMKSAQSDSRLSDRELQVLRLIGAGVGTSRVANELHLSVKTIETHRMRIKQKLGLQNGAELNRYAEDWLKAHVRKHTRIG